MLYNERSDYLVDDIVIWYIFGWSVKVNRYHEYRPCVSNKHAGGEISHSGCVCLSRSGLGKISRPPLMAFNIRLS